MRELLVLGFWLTLAVCLAVIIVYGVKTMRLMRREAQEDAQIREILRMLAEGRAVFGCVDQLNAQILCRRVGEPDLYVCRNGLTFWKVERENERQTVLEFLRSCDWWEEST